MKKIISQNIQRLWLVGGAELADSFYKFGYIDEFIVTVLPKKLEEGIALPPPLSAKKNFKLLKTINFSLNITQYHFKSTI